MRVGLRLQLLLAFGSLLTLAFVPLLFVVAGLTRATLVSLGAKGAIALAREIAAHTASCEPNESSSSLLVRSPTEGVLALGLYDARGKLLDRAGDVAFAHQLPSSVALGTETARTLRVGDVLSECVIVPMSPLRKGSVAESSGAPSHASSVGVVLRIDSPVAPTGALLRLVALYMGTVAVALLAFLYMATTRLVINPVDALSLAARRVADGARALQVPRRGAFELMDLASSLERMTSRLRGDEEALRAKMTEIRRYAEDLGVAQENLVRSERLASVGRLSAGLAHEIGNPVAAILGFQELLLTGDLDENQRHDFLVRMNRETERVHRILRDLLDFARPAALQGVDQSPDGHLERLGAEVASALDEVMSLVRPQKALRNVSLDAQVASGIPPVRMEHTHLVQVLVNLLLNAADAVPQTGARILVEAAWLGDANCAEIAVSDNGGGIPRELADRLFEPFATTKPIGKGTGLGLAVCKGLVDAVGGSICVEVSGLGGARFVVRLPPAAPLNHR